MHFSTNIDKAHWHIALAQRRQGSFYRALPSGRLGCGLRFSHRGCRGHQCGCRCGRCRRSSWGNCGAAGAAAGAVIADAVAGADSAGVAGSASSAAGVVAEVVAGRRPPELVVVMTGSVRFGSVRFGSALFWTEVFFVDFFAVRAVKGAVFWFSGFCLVGFFGFLDFFREFCPPRHKKP